MIPTERLPNEGARPFAMFRTFLDLGDKRTLAKVAKKCSKSTHLVRKFSKIYKWKDRLRTWQLEEVQRANAASEQAKLEHARELEARDATRREDAWKYYQRFIEVAAEHLSLPQGNSKPVDASRLMQTAQILGAIACGDDINEAVLSGKGLQPPAPVTVNYFYRAVGTNGDRP
jgi:hypothetical protein